LLSELIKDKKIKKRKPEILTPGGDKLEYMLDKTGVRLRNKITKEISRILLLNKDNRKTILTQLLMKDTNVIADIVSELSEELLEQYEGKTLKNLQKKIYNTVENHIFRVETQ